MVIRGMILRQLSCAFVPVGWGGVGNNNVVFTLLLTRSCCSLHFFTYLPAGSCCYALHFFKVKYMIILLYVGTYHGIGSWCWSWTPSSGPNDVYRNLTQVLKRIWNKALEVWHKEIETKKRTQTHILEKTHAKWIRHSWKNRWLSVSSLPST